MRFPCLILLVLLLPMSVTAGGLGDSVDEPSPDADTTSTATPPDFANPLSTIGHVATSPLRWSGDEWLIAGGVVAVGFASATLDDEVRAAMRRNNSGLNDGIREIGYDYGAPEFAGPAAIGFYLVGAVTGNAWIRGTGLMLIESMVTIGLVQIPARIIAGRARPRADEGNASFNLFKGADQNHASFISGHSAIAFAASTVLSRRIDNTWATIGLYTLASLTPWARLYEDDHWLSDTVAGSLLGFLIGSAVVEYNHAEGLLGARVRIVPTLNGATMTLAW